MDNLIKALNEIKNGSWDIKLPRSIYQIPDNIEDILLETYHVPRYFDDILEEIATKIDQLFFDEMTSTNLNKRKHRIIDTFWYFNADQGVCTKNFDPNNSLQYRILIRIDTNEDGQYTLAIKDIPDVYGKRQIVICANMFFIATYYGAGTARGIDLSDSTRNSNIDKFKEELKHEFLHVTERFFNKKGIDPTKSNRKSKYFTIEYGEENDYINKDSVPYDIDEVSKFFYYFNESEMNARLSELYQHVTNKVGLSSKDTTDFVRLKQIERNTIGITHIDFMHVWKDRLKKELCSNGEVDPDIAYLVLSNQRVERFKHLKSIGYVKEDIKNDSYSDNAIKLYHKQVEKIYKEVENICENYMNKILKTIFSALKGKEYFNGSPLEEAVKAYSEKVVFDKMQYVILENLDLRRRNPYDIL